MVIMKTNILPATILEHMNELRILRYWEARTGKTTARQEIVEQFLREQGYMDDRGALLPLEIKL